METIELTTVVCTYQRYHLLPAAIESVISQDLDREVYEVVVVDNSGDPDIAECFGRRYQEIPNLRYVHESVPGLSRARNIGAGLARGRVVAFIDDDAVAAPNWAGNLVSVYASLGPTIGVVGGL